MPYAQIPGGAGENAAQRGAGRTGYEGYDPGAGGAYAAARPAGPIADPGVADPFTPNVQMPQIAGAGRSPAGTFQRPPEVANQPSPRAGTPQGYSAPPWQQDAEAAARTSGVASRARSDRAPAMRSSPPPAAPPAEALPAGSPPLGLEGFCAVQLLEKNQWVRGNSRYGVIHRGRTYLFSGPEEAKRFYSAPDRYAPALAGNDVVLAVDQAVSAMGTREIGARYEDRIYLFTSEESYQRFYQDPERYAGAVEAHDEHRAAKRPADGWLAGAEFEPLAGRPVLEPTPEPCAAAESSGRTEFRQQFWVGSLIRSQNLGSCCDLPATQGRSGGSETGSS